MNSSLSPICWLKLLLVRLLNLGCGLILQQILGDQSGLKGKHDHHSISMRSDMLPHNNCRYIRKCLVLDIMLICAEKCTINVLKDTINLGNISSVNAQSTNFCNLHLQKDVFPWNIDPRFHNSSHLLSRTKPCR